MRMSLGLVAALAAVVSCSPGAPEGAVGEAASELGEARCESLTDKDVIKVDAGYCGDGFAASPDAMYDHQGCPHQFVVGYGSLYTPTYARVWWEDAPLTNQAACESAHLTLTAYVRNHTWTQQTTTLHGSWIPFLTRQCVFFYDEGSLPLDAVGTGSYHRLAAAAFYKPDSTTTEYARVGVQLYLPCQSEGTGSDDAGSDAGSAGSEDGGRGDAGADGHLTSYYGCSAAPSSALSYPAILLTAGLVSAMRSRKRASWRRLSSAGKRH